MKSRLAAAAMMIAVGTLLYLIRPALLEAG